MNNINISPGDEVICIKSFNKNGLFKNIIFEKGNKYIVISSNEKEIALLTDNKWSHSFKILNDSSSRLIYFFDNFRTIPKNPYNIGDKVISTNNDYYFGRKGVVGNIVNFNPDRRIPFAIRWENGNSEYRSFDSFVKAVKIKHLDIDPLEEEDWGWEQQS